MKKTSIILVILSFYVLNGCSLEPENLTRIDVEKVSSNGSSKTFKMITADKKINQLSEKFEKIKWQNSLPSMTRQEDVRSTFFYVTDKNSPEELVEYSICWNDKGNAEFIKERKEKSSYGTLNKKQSQALRKELGVM